MGRKSRSSLERYASSLLRGSKKKRRRHVNAPKPKPKPTSYKWTDNTRSLLLAKTNAAETRINELLLVSGILFTREYAASCDKSYFIDFVAEVGDMRIAVEVDGKSHFTASGQRADRKRERDIMKSDEAHAFLRLSWAKCLSMTRKELVDAILTTSTLRGCVILMM